MPEAPQPQQPMLQFDTLIQAGKRIQRLAFRFPACSHGENQPMTIITGKIPHRQSMCICHKHRWQTALICKNGNSSLIASKGVYDGVVKSESIKSPEEPIWCLPEAVRHQESCIASDTFQPDPSYTSFIVIREPIERFVSYANWVIKNYSQLATINTALRQRGVPDTLPALINATFFLLTNTQPPTISADDPHPLIFDPHARLQSTTIEETTARYPDIHWQLIPLQDLSNFYVSNLSKDPTQPLITNNVTPTNHRYVTIEDIKASGFYRKLVSFLDKDIDMWYSATSSRILPTEASER